MFEKVKNLSDKDFYNIIGVKRTTFNKMVDILKSAEQEKRKLKPTTPKNKLSIEDRLLMTLEYLKEYCTYRVIAVRYGIHHTSCIRNTHWVENVLIKHPDFHITGKKKLVKNIN